MGDFSRNIFVFFKIMGCWEHSFVHSRDRRLDWLEKSYTKKETALYSVNFFFSPILVHSEKSVCVEINVLVNEWFSSFGPIFCTVDNQSWRSKQIKGM